MTRFLADENVSRLVIEQLRIAGYDVTRVGEISLGAADDDVLATARREDRVLITEDRDFGELVIRQRLNVRGIVLLELDRLSNGAEADRVAAVISTTGEKLLGNLIVIEPGRIRIRPLSPGEP
jgi:predicted nuclease of predicted toxin-antitoxin system